jgi:hypothetical protein
MIQLTKWVESEDEIRFAVDQINKYNPKCGVIKSTTKRGRKFFAVFKIKK